MSSLIAFDLGTKTGWAALLDNKSLHSGVEIFAPKPGESAGMRYLKFEVWLIKMFKMVKPQLVVYERPNLRFGKATAVIDGLAAILIKTCEQMHIEYTKAVSSQIKKHATGRGNANKDEMIAAARKKFPQVEIIDDNHADSLWLLHFAYEEYASCQ